tara:strand:- start:49 stop:453 length:405 start_codon:yes stop_codon:yes gene_type:complete
MPGNNKKINELWKATPGGLGLMYAVQGPPYLNQRGNQYAPSAGPGTPNSSLRQRYDDCKALADVYSPFNPNGYTFDDGNLVGGSVANQKISHFQNTDLDGGSGLVGGTFINRIITFDFSTWTMVITNQNDLKFG